MEAASSALPRVVADLQERMLRLQERIDDQAAARASRRDVRRGQSRGRGQVLLGGGGSRALLLQYRFKRM